jgi:hypothetical protein
VTRVARGFLVAVVAVVAIAVVAAGGTAVMVGHRVIGSSMTPTLVDGELPAANPLDHRPARFDVVVLRRSTGPIVADQLVDLELHRQPGDRQRRGEHPVEQRGREQRDDDRTRHQRQREHPPPGSANRLGLQSSHHLKETGPTWAADHFGSSPR